MRIGLQLINRLGQLMSALTAFICFPTGSLFAETVKSDTNCASEVYVWFIHMLDIHVSVTKLARKCAELFITIFTIFDRGVDL